MGEVYPSCPTCGSEAWSSLGWSWSSITQHSLACHQCKREALYVSQDARCRAVFLMDPSEEGIEYINKVLIPTWRAHAASRDTHKRQAEQGLYTKVRDSFDLTAEEYPGVNWLRKLISCHYGIPMDELQGRGVGLQAADEVPAIQQIRRLAEEFDASYKEDPFLKAAPYPPQVPDALLLYFISGGQWVKVDPDYSRTLEVPEDPIVTWNNNVYKQVREALGMPAAEWSPVENAYGGIDPWYRFCAGSATFTVGRRKRVWTIQAAFEHPVPTHPIRTLAVERDDVTYTAHAPPKKVPIEDIADSEVSLVLLKRTYPSGIVDGYEAGGWRSTLPKAVRIEVHAWTVEHLVEYLATLLKMAGVGSDP